MINVRHLAVFRAVVRCGSVSGAARILHVSQPAVTKTLQNIQDRLGVPLFVRIKGRLHATPESALLMPKVDQIFRAVEDVEHLAEEISGGGVGRISLATVSTLNTAIAMSAVASYRKIRPNVVFDIRALSTKDVMELVSNNQVDLGLLDVEQGEGYFETQELCRALIGCVVPRDHRLAGRRSVRPKDLKGEVLVSFTDDTMTGSALRERFRIADTSLKISITSNQSLAACVLAQSGAGIALVDPFPMLTGLFPKLTIIPIDPPIEIRPRIIFPPTRPLSIAAGEFVHMIKQVVANLVPSSPLLYPCPD